MVSGRPIRSLALAALLAALAACGQNDPAPPAGSASASAINASVVQAQNQAVNASMAATGTPDTPAAREKAAQNVLGEANTVAGGTQ